METIWTLFEAAAGHHGTRCAFVEGSREVPYAALAESVSQLAARLAERGVEPGDRVAVLDVNSTGYLAATFAVAGLGAILQPLNHRLSGQELAEILRDAGTRALLAGAALEERAHSLGSEVEVLSLEATGDEPSEFTPRPPAPSDVAHLYYTSGTTGRPKGVMLTHANVCTHARAAIGELRLVSDDRWGHFAPMFHLADAWAIVAITAVGARHVLEPHFEPEAVLARMQTEGVTLTNLVPTMLNALVAHPAAGAFDGTALRMILSGGAPISPTLVRRIVEVFGCEYVQTYGMTETSPYLTLSLLPEHLRALPEEERLRYAARTGRPFAGVELEVVDEADRPVPADDRTVGEIRVRGASVTPGYWRRPAETAAALRGGWLYTGDLAVVDAEGFVDIVDRKKDVILTGGETVYSTEVENALHAHPAVHEAAVFGVPDPHWGETVRAAVVLASGQQAAEQELIAFCRERIAHYKAPRAIDFREELPRTGSGKLAKHRLRKDGAGGPMAGGPMSGGPMSGADPGGAGE